MARLRKTTDQSLSMAGNKSQDLLNLFKGSEILYQDLFDNASDAIFIRDLHGDIVKANKAAAGITGYSRSNLSEMNISELLTERSFNLAMRRQRVHLKDETSLQRYELELVRKDGSIRNAESVTSLITFNGRPIGIQAIVRDITERKQAEEALRESEEKYRTLFENMLNGYAYCKILVDENNQPIDFIYLEVNNAFEKLTGLRRENVVGRKVTEAIPGIKEATPELFDIYGKVALTGEPTKFDIYFEPLGIWFTISVNSPQRGYFVAVFDNITERKQAEEALRESEAQYRDLLENANDLIQSVTPDGHFVYVNKIWLKVLGYSVEEVTSLILWDIIHPDSIPKCREAFQKVLLGEAVSNVEAVFVAKDGKLVTVEGNISCRSEGGQPVATRGIFRDITEQKRLRDNMEFYISEITKAQEEERKRIARELHDEPVQSLAALAYGIDALAKKKEKMPEDALQSLEELRANANIVLAQLRRSVHQLRPGVLDQVGLVAALELLAEELDKEAQIKTSLRITGYERRLAPETELVLFRVAQEALSNVRRHSGAKKAAIRILFAQTKVNLAVSDNGCGFKIPETLGNFATESKLGLLGMQERARLLDGIFSVKSQVGKGTIVRIECAT